MRSILVAIAQVIGGIVASAVVLAVFPGKLAVQTTLSDDTSVGQGFLIELFLTFQLLISIMMLAGEKHAATFMAPIGIGLSLFIAELSGVSFTGGSLNPARSFGPALVLGDFPPGALDLLGWASRGCRSRCWIVQVSQDPGL